VSLEMAGKGSSHCGETAILGNPQSPTSELRQRVLKYGSISAITEVHIPNGGGCGSSFVQPISGEDQAT
jgi:hypothetical protein